MSDVAYLATHLQEALAQDPRVHEPQLRVAIRGGRVQVTGDVPTAERKEAVTDVIRELQPSLEVENLIEVTAADAEPRTERLT
jgi:osmotically-inducible protein OsmY